MTNINLAQVPTLIDKYADIFEGNLDIVEDSFKKQNRRMSKRTLRWWIVVEFRQLLQRYGEEIRKYIEKSTKGKRS